MRFFFIISFLFFILFNVFCTDNIQVDLINYENDGVNISFDLRITNNSRNSYWFHYDSSMRYINVYGNILYYFPNFCFFSYNFNNNGIFYFLIEEILPQETIVKSYSYENRGYNIVVDLLRGVTTRNTRENLSNIEYLNTMLIFFNREINTAMSIREYKNSIYNEGIINTKIFKLSAL